MIKIEGRAKPLTHRYMKRSMGPLSGAQTVLKFEGAKSITVTGFTVHTDLTDLQVSFPSLTVTPGEVLDIVYKLYVKEIK